MLLPLRHDRQEPRPGLKSSSPDGRSQGDDAVRFDGATHEMPATAAALSALDLHVVRLAMKDGVDTVDASDEPRVRPQARSSGQLAKQLANPQLEALRRYAVRFHATGGAPSAADKIAVLKAGYSEAQVQSAEDLIRHLLPDLAGRRGNASKKGIMIGMAVLSLTTCVWLAHALQNGVVALIVFGVVAVTVASFFARSPR